MVASDSDEQLSARLDSALRAGPGSDQVDVARLLSGSQSRARRLRTQRIGVAVAAAVLVIALPVGWQAARSRFTGEEGPSAVMLHSPRPSVRQAPSPATSDPRTRPSGRELVAIAQAELPPKLILGSAAEAAPAGPIIGGLDCPAKGAGVQPRQREATRWHWQMAESAPEDYDHVYDVVLSHTRWPTVQAAATVFATQTHGTSGCHWRDPQHPVLLQGFPADDSWAATTPDWNEAGRVAVRVGADIIGIQVTGAKTSAAALVLAQKLAHAEAVRLAAGGSTPGT